MMRQPFSETERQRRLTARRESWSRYNAAMDRIAACVPGSNEESEVAAAAEVHLEAATMAEERYFEQLPRFVTSCCPFDGKPLVRTFDPYGIDGLWWRPDATPIELPTCPHFCFVRGAVNFRGQAPCQDDLRLHPGPESPYVIPRILGKPGMIAVISQLDMTPGCTAYWIAYFAERRPPAQELAANWPRTIYLYTTALGAHRWRCDDESSDFDLHPWLAQGKIRWCEPGSNNESLSTAPPDRCPYAHLRSEHSGL